jgi:hypothetical protein
LSRTVFTRNTSTSAQFNTMQFINIWNVNAIYKLSQPITSFDCLLFFSFIWRLRLQQQILLAIICYIVGVLGVRFKITILHMKYYISEVRCKFKFINIIFVILNNVTIFRVCFSLSTFTMLDGMFRSVRIEVNCVTSPLCVQ